MASSPHSTRDALLDAAERLMIEEGYAAVTTRRIAELTGTRSPLVYHYFDSMDELFREIVRRNAERALASQAIALRSPQPLWALWMLGREHAGNPLTLEFVALGNHRKPIKAEILMYAQAMREAQLAGLTDVLKRYGFDPDEWPAAALVVLISGISSVLQIEQSYDFNLGHADLVAVVERHIRSLEGDPGPAS